MWPLIVEYTQEGEKKHESFQLNPPISKHQLQSIIAERLGWDVNSFRILLNGSTTSTETALCANDLNQYATVNLMRNSKDMHNQQKILPTKKNN